MRNIIRDGMLSITLVLGLGMRAKLGFGGKSGVEVWCFQINFLPPAKGNYLSNKLGERKGMRLSRDLRFKRNFQIGSDRAP